MRRLQEKLNYVCRCGHVKRLHEGDDYSEYCTADISKDDKIFGLHCLCNGYVVDNLKYLEKLSDAKA